MSTSFEISGTILEILPAQSFNKGFRKREFVLEVGDKYPQKIIFQLVQEKCELIDSYSVGDTLTVSFNIKGRDWTDKNSGQVKYFTTLEVWKVQGQKRNPASFTESDDDLDAAFGELSSSPKKKSNYQATAHDDDDLPF